MANALFYRIKVTAIEQLIYSLSNQSYSKKVVVIRESRRRINLQSVKSKLYKKGCGYKRIEETTCVEGDHIKTK